MRSNSGVSKPPCSIVAGGRDIAKFVLFKVICDLMKHQITSLFNVQFFPKRHKFLAKPLLKIKTANANFWIYLSCTD